MIFATAGARRTAKTCGHGATTRVLRKIACRNPYATFFMDLSTARTRQGSEGYSQGHSVVV